MKYLGAAGLDMGGEKITNLGAGTANTDAANGTQVGGVYTYNGSAYVVDPDVRVFIKKTGDPDPAGATSNDIILTQS